MSIRATTQAFLIAVVLVALAVLPDRGRAQQPPPNPPAASPVATDADAVGDPTADLDDDPARLGTRIDDVIPARLPDGSRPRIRARDLSRLLDREMSIIETLESLSFGVRKKQVELEAVQRQRAQLETQLAEYEILFRKEERALAEHGDRIRNRLRAVRHATRMGGFALLASSESFVDYLRRERLLRRLLEQDKVRLVEYRNAIARFRLSQAELGRRRDELALVEREIEEAIAEIEQDHADHAELLRRVDEERTYYEKYHAELQRRSRLIATKVERLERWRGPAWFDAHRGRFAPPITPSRVAVAYGYRVHPRFNVRVLHRGITFEPTRVGEALRVPVRVIYTGKVVHAGWVSGFGNTVIVDHTRGYHTLYARLARITVQEGQILDSRDQIGFIRTSGRSGRELYFEIRQEGEPIDPTTWLR